MNSQEQTALVTRIVAVRTELKMAANTSSDEARIAYIRSARESLDALEATISEKPANLLTHLCSLTVAERETILRVSEIVLMRQQVAYTHVDLKLDTIETANISIQATLGILEKVEAALREPLTAP